MSQNRDTSRVQAQSCSLRGDLSSLAICSSARFGRSDLCRISSEARFADQGFQFRIFTVEGAWYIEGNPCSVNLTAVNGVPMSVGTRLLKPNDVIGLVGRKTGRQAMRICFKIANLCGANPILKTAVSFSTPMSRQNVASPKSGKGSPLIVGLDQNETELQAIVVEGWKKFASEIDITNFVRRTNWTPERIHACVQGAVYNHPEVFYFTRTINLGQWRRRDGELVKIVLRDIQYDFPASEYGIRKHKFDTAVSGALSCVGGADGEVDKMLRLHDYLVRVCDYDLAAAKANDRSCLARTAYSALVRHRAVCEGYTMAYRHLLNAVGIVSDVAVSVKDSHVWNYVRMGGNWYHIDVTYDDPICIGRAQQNIKISHKHFLMSDAKALKTGHHAWNVHGLPAAKDKHYDEIYKE